MGQRKKVGGWVGGRRWLGVGGNADAVGSSRLGRAVDQPNKLKRGGGEVKAGGVTRARCVYWGGAKGLVARKEGCYRCLSYLR